MNDLTEKGDVKSQTYSDFSRPKCPFYGFNIILNRNLMIDTEGNQCGLIGDSYAPCQMEVHGDKPDWKACPINTRERMGKLDLIKDAVVVIPRGLQKGTSLSHWMDYILSK